MRLSWNSRVLASVSDCFTMTHTQSGLLNLVRESSDTYITVEEEIIKLLKKYGSKYNTSLCKSNTDRAMNDIRESIYEKILFKGD